MGARQRPGVLFWDECKNRIPHRGWCITHCRTHASARHQGCSSLLNEVRFQNVGRCEDLQYMTAKPAVLQCRHRRTPVSDIYSKAKRSWIMSQVRGKNTSPELQLRSFLHRGGLRFRLHVRCLPGTPDIVLPRHRIVIFVHGCFWHGHRGCSRATFPRTNRTFWLRKIKGNIGRDIQTYAALRKLGWSVRVVWTCKLKNNRSRARTLARLLREIRER